MAAPSRNRALGRDTCHGHQYPSPRFASPRSAIAYGIGGTVFRHATAEYCEARLVRSITGFPTGGVPIEKLSAARPVEGVGGGRMTTLVREQGTYRTPAGELMPLRIDREGGLASARASRRGPASRPAGEAVGRSGLARPEPATLRPRALRRLAPLPATRLRLALLATCLVRRGRGDALGRLPGRTRADERRRLMRASEPLASGLQSARPGGR